MRWLRDNWIDALIFTVFAITVVGIVLFLTGVNPFKSKSPGMGRTAPTAHEVVEQPQTPEVPEVPIGDGQQAEEPQTPAVTVVPLLPGSQEDTGAASAKPATSATQPPASQTSTSGNGATSSGTAATAPAGSVNLPGGPENGVFRVSVGAFGNPENALALAEKLKKQGFPVRLEPVGKVTRVVVGPYSTKTQAAEAARKLASYDPQVYRGDTPVPEGVYLQVGAYKELSSAEGLVAKLREAGVGPIVFYYKDPWLKVWIGPVDAARASELKQKLQDMGLQVVEVR